MNHLRARIEKLETTVTPVAPEPPPESEKARAAREEFQAAFDAFRETGDDEQEKTARCLFRTWLKATRGAGVE